MEKWKPLNMELRSWVISLMLRLEQTSSAALKAIFRILKIDTKTLGNQSSVLPFKSKIDMLFDLEEINKEEYNHLIKLMEIRNQFAHNPNAVSFETFDFINADINKYLLKNCPKNLTDLQDRELKLKTIFSELFKKVIGKLLSIEIEYKGGVKKDIRKFVNDKIVENIDEIWNEALKKNSYNNAPSLIGLIGYKENQLESFYRYFIISMLEFRINELNKIEGDLSVIFKQKETIEEAFVRIEKGDK